MFDVLTFGSVTFDIIVRVPENNDSKPDIDLGTWQLPLGDKVKIDTSTASIGGGAVNSATGFERLGLHSACFGVVGDQSFKTFLLQQLEAVGVDTQYLTMAKGTPSSFSVILNSHVGERTVFHHRASCKTFDAQHLPILPSTKAVYTGHLYPKAEDILFKVAKEKKAQNFFWGWNPGKTQFRNGLETYKKIAPQVDLLVLNVEEAENFTGLEASKIEKTDIKVTGEKIPTSAENKVSYYHDVRLLAKTLMQAGFGTVAITDGSRGAQIFTEKQHYYMPSSNAPKIDTLGAGDAFSVGLMSGMLYKKDLPQAILWGALYADGVINYLGAQDGQMTLLQLQQQLLDCKS